MIAGKKLLELIDRAVEGEEHLIAIYCNHCALFAELVEPDPEAVAGLRATFMKLRDDSRRHQETLEGLRSTIGSSDGRSAY